MPRCVSRRRAVHFARVVCAGRTGKERCEEEDVGGIAEGEYMVRHARWRGREINARARAPS